MNKQLACLTRDAPPEVSVRPDFTVRTKGEIFLALKSSDYTTAVSVEKRRMKVWGQELSAAVEKKSKELQQKMIELLDLLAWRDMEQN